MPLNQFSRKTSTSLYGGFRCLLMVMGLFWGIRGEAQIVPVYVTSETHSPDYTFLLTTYTTVENPSFAINGNPGAATLKSLGGTLGVATYAGSMELIFPSSLPAGTTSYVKLDFDSDALNALLGGNLGGALADLLGTLVLGNHYFNVKARNGITSVLNGSSQNNFGTDALRLIIDSNGDYLLAITPSLPYDRIYIEDVTSSLLLGTSNFMNVHSAFYLTGQDPCDPAFATSFDGSGGTVDLVGLGQAGVTNPEFAIDSNPATASELSPGVVTLGGSISQTIYFQSLSAPTDEYHLRLFVDSPALLNLSLLDGISVDALDGDTVISSTQLSALLDLDLLGLLNTDEVVEVFLAPGNSFDRIRIKVDAALDINLSKTVKIYEAYRSSPPPSNITVDPPNSEVCYGEQVGLTATTDSTNELVWYSEKYGGTPIATTANNAIYQTGNLTSDTTFYVASKLAGCLRESARDSVKITVFPDIGTPTLTIDGVVD